MISKKRNEGISAFAMEAHDGLFYFWFVFAEQKSIKNGEGRGKGGGSYQLSKP